MFYEEGNAFNTFIRLQGYSLLVSNTECEKKLFMSKH